MHTTLKFEHRNLKIHPSAPNKFLFEVSMFNFHILWLSSLYQSRTTTYPMLRYIPSFYLIFKTTILSQFNKNNSLDDPLYLARVTTTCLSWSVYRLYWSDKLWGQIANCATDCKRFVKGLFSPGLGRLSCPKSAKSKRVGLWWNLRAKTSLRNLSQVQVTVGTDELWWAFPKNTWFKPHFQEVASIWWPWDQVIKSSSISVAGPNYILLNGYILYIYIYLLYSNLCFHAQVSAGCLKSGWV